VSGVSSGALSSSPAAGPARTFARPPESVAYPESAGEVADTLRSAASRGLGVLPVASGRRLRAPALDRPYVLLVTERLRGVEIYEPADLTLTAGAGTLMADVAETLGAHGQWLPFDPPEVDSRTLGGLVATGESGPMWMGYGELKNHVLGATVVTGDGRVLKLGGRVVKNVAGFDLLRPMVGSRGRLAVITSVCVRAFPRPEVDATLVLRADRVQDLYGAAAAVGTAPILPASCALFAPAVALGAGAALVVRLHGSAATVAADQRTLERHVGRPLERVSEAVELHRVVRDQAADGIVLEARVLPSRLGTVVEAVLATLGQGGVADRVPPELVADTYLSSLRVAAPTLEAATAARLRNAVEAAGGTLSVHGNGSAAAKPGVDAARVAELAAEGSPPRPQEADLVAGLERVFDPDGVLWPCRT